MMGADLFDWTPPPGYPRAPGWTEPTTSRDAAKAAGITASRLREDLLRLYRVAWPAGMTADEAAAKIGRSVLSIRPRISELRRMGELLPTLHPGTAKPWRRTNASGLMATVLVCKRPT